MPYVVTRQRQWPDGNPMVEVSVGGMDYTNPDALSPKYPGEMEEYDSPVEAVQVAIRICEQWRDDEPEAEIGVGSTLGMTMPFEPITSDEAIAWAEWQWPRSPSAAGVGKCCHKNTSTSPNWTMRSSAVSSAQRKRTTSL